MSTPVAREEETEDRCVSSPDDLHSMHTGDLMQRIVTLK
jgi:hypothetical protein